MVRKSLWWILVLPVATLAALAAAPPNVGKAVEAQRQLAVERPRDPAVFNDLGNLLLLAGRLEEAEDAYRRAVELDPQKGSALFNLGLLLQQKGELKEAQERYRKAVELEPGHAWAHYQSGSIYELWGQESRAVHAYARAFALDPQLAFPEVNPHVVDNHLVTEAMLEAYREGYTPPQAPKVYDDPLRIAALLVPPVPSEKAPAAPAPPAAGQGQPGVNAPGATPGAPRVLGETSLDRGSNAGQATPGGPGGTGRPAAPTRPSIRTWTRPEPEFDHEGNPEILEVPEEEPFVPPVPGGVIYRPDLPSTGRLDIRVVPDRGAATRSAPAGR